MPTDQKNSEPNAQTQQVQTEIFQAHDSARNIVLMHFVGNPKEQPREDHSQAQGEGAPVCKQMMPGPGSKNAERHVFHGMKEIRVECYGRMLIGTTGQEEDKEGINPQRNPPLPETDLTIAVDMAKCERDDSADNEQEDWHRHLIRRQPKEARDNESANRLDGKDCRDPCPGLALHKVSHNAHKP